MYLTEEQTVDLHFIEHLDSLVWAKGTYEDYLRMQRTLVRQKDREPTPNEVITALISEALSQCTSDTSRDVLRRVMKDYTSTRERAAACGKE